MLKDERQDLLVALCNEHHALTVREAAKALNISDMTARRDFDELAAQGRLARVYGGVRSVRERTTPGVPAATPVVPRVEENHRVKAEIAQRAAALIEPGDVIFIENGTTMEALAQQLPAVPMTIVTTSISIFGLIVDSAAFTQGLYELYLTGGKYHEPTMTLTGPLAYEAVQAFGLTKAFVGANGIDGNAVYGHSQDRGYSVRLALDASKERYVASASTKIGKRDTNAFYQLNRIDAVITDRDITPEQRTMVEEHTKVLTC